MLLLIGYNEIPFAFPEDIPESVREAVEPVTELVVPKSEPLDSHCFLEAAGTLVTPDGRNS